MPEDPIQPDDEFAADVRAIYRSDAQVPTRIDEAILNRARAHFARPRSSRGLVLRIGALVTAAAAVVVVAVYLATPEAHTHQARVAVDIVDALRVARDIRDGRTDVSRDDFNHDGTVDRRDVDAIAMAAVRLPEEKVQ